MPQPSNRALTVTRSAKSGPFFYERILRPGWGVLLFCGLFLFFARTIMWVFLHSGVRYHFSRAQHLHSPIEYAPEIVSLLALCIAFFLISILEHRTLSTYGYSSKRKLPLLCIGFVSGIALVSALVGIMLHLGVLVLDARQLFGVALFKYACLHLIAFFAVAFFEESGFRGYLQYTLTRGLSFLYRRIFGVTHPLHWAFWTSAFMLAALSVIMHVTNRGETTLGLITIGGFALLAAWSLWRTGSLWWAIGFHLACDFAQAFLYGTPTSGYQIRERLFASHPQGDSAWSGGTTGPEGSLLFLLLIAAAATLVIFLPREQLYPDLQTPVKKLSTTPDPDSLRRHTR